MSFSISKLRAPHILNSEAKRELDFSLRKPCSIRGEAAINHLSRMLSAISIGAFDIAMPIEESRMIIDRYYASRYAQFLAFSLLLDGDRHEGTPDQLTTFLNTQRHISNEYSSITSIKAFARDIESTFPLGLADSQVNQSFELASAFYAFWLKEKPTIRRENIDEILKADNFDALATAPGFSILQRRYPEMDMALGYNCAVFVFGDTLSMPDGDTFQFGIAPFGYRSQDKQEAGQLVIYFHNRRAQHFGIAYNEEYVVSKFNYGHIYMHPTWAVPTYWGFPRLYSIAEADTQK